MLVYNPTSENVHVQALGSHFEFKAGQIKSMGDSVATWILLKKGYLGLVSLPEICVEDPNSKEAKEAKEYSKSAGINARIDYLKAIISNEEISLRQDLDKNNNKASVESFMSKGMLKNYRELATYKVAQDIEDAKMADDIKKARELLK